MCGIRIFIPGNPRRAQMSLKLHAEALTLRTTSLGPGLGSAISLYCRTSRPPLRSKTMAFIRYFVFTMLFRACAGVLATSYMFKCWSLIQTMLKLPETLD